jgi:uncharacterized protein YjbI with pentapeptide repeats
VLRDSDLTGADRTEDLSDADLSGAKGRSSASEIFVRFLVAAGIGVLIIGVVLAIVRRTRGIAADA